jgi:hypothetical protein
MILFPLVFPALKYACKYIKIQIAELYINVAHFPGTNYLAITIIIAQLLYRGNCRPAKNLTVKIKTSYQYKENLYEYIFSMIRRQRGTQHKGLFTRLISRRDFALS